jgi:hypothetical protein
VFDDQLEQGQIEQQYAQQVEWVAGHRKALDDCLQLSNAVCRISTTVLIIY